MPGVCLPARLTRMLRTLRFAGLPSLLFVGAMLPTPARAADAWLTWSSTGIVSDLTENGLRDIGLPAGLVDNKICAIDERWSAIRFVFRVQDRPPKPHSSR